MKTYKENKHGSFSIGNRVIPNAPGNKDYQKMQMEIESDEAELIPFDHSAKFMEDQVLKLREVRERYRQTGFVFHGKTIPATRESQSDLLGITLAYSNMTLLTTESVNWKVASGDYLIIANKTMAMDFGAKMFAYIQKCFSAEGFVTTLLQSDLQIDIELEFKNYMNN